MTKKEPSTPHLFIHVNPKISKKKTPSELKLVRKMALIKHFLKDNVSHTSKSNRTKYKIQCKIQNTKQNTKYKQNTIR